MYQEFIVDQTGQRSGLRSCRIKNFFTGNRRAPELLNVIGHHFCGDIQVDVGRADWAVHGPGQVADENDIDAALDPVPDAQGFAHDAHVGGTAGL